VEIGLLGPLLVVVDGEEQRLGRPKQRAALALLSLHPRTVVPIGRLVDAMWGERPPPTVGNAAQGHIAALRKLLGPDRIETHPSGYLLRVADEELDTRQFERLLDHSRSSSDAKERAAHADAALALFRGEPLSEFRYDPFAVGEIARLEELRLEAVEQYVQAELELGHHAEVIPRLVALVEENPLRERLHGQLMLALYLGGRQAEALARYGDLRRRMLDELGLEPSPELRRLQRAILQHDPELLGVATLRSRRMPAEVDRFVGRSAELARLSELVLRRARLVTVTGPGGSGKTRLALHTAAGFTREEFPDGVYFVDLAALARPGLVLAAVAAAVGLPDSGIPFSEALASRFGEKRLLLLLDNFEHVLSDATELSSLLTACPGLRVIATSRTPLRIRGEHLLDVEPLDAEAAIDLFVDRASAAGADAGDLRGQAELVDAICSRVDRLPLAVELAAVRARELDPSTLLERLNRRLDLLTEGAADLPSRQRTLRAGIAWSYDLLQPDDQRLFRALSPFRGGFTLTAAEQVCGLGSQTLDALVRLIEQRLVRRLDSGAAEPRFGLLETVREFAEEQAAAQGELDVVERAFATYFAGLAEELGPSMRRPEREVAPAFARLSADLDNFRALYNWACEHDDADPGLRVLAATWLWSWTWLGETLGWTERLLDLPSARGSNARPGALFVAAALSWALGDLDRVATYGNACVDASQPAGDHAHHALALALLLSVHVDDAETGTAIYEEAKGVAAASDDGWVAAFVDVGFGFYNALRGDGEPATVAGRKAEAHFTALGAPRHALLSQLPIGFGLLQTGDFAGARELLEPAIAEFERIENWKMAEMAAIGAGMATRFAGDTEAAKNLYERARAICDEAGDPTNLPLCLEGIAATTAADDPTAAAQTLGAAAAAFETGRTPTVPGYAAFAGHTYSVLEDLLGDRFDAAFETGRLSGSRNL
jgi:predicted ATPase/DNA-binding SARP family transcriptional activator